MKINRDQCSLLYYFYLLNQDTHSHPFNCLALALDIFLFLSCFIPPRVKSSVTKGAHRHIIPLPKWNPHYLQTVKKYLYTWPIFHLSCPWKKVVIIFEKKQYYTRSPPVLPATSDNLKRGENFPQGSPFFFQPHRFLITQTHTHAHICKSSFSLTCTSVCVSL